MTPDDEKKIKRMITLLNDQEEKRKQNEDLEMEEQVELARLLAGHPKYKDKDSEAAQKIFEGEKTKDLPHVHKVDKKDVNSMITDWEEQFGKSAQESWYKAPVVEGNKIWLTFPSIEKEIEFGMDQAKQGRSFMVIDDKTSMVTAYSNGDGKLYHGNGKKFEQGDSYTPGSTKEEDFVMPPPNYEDDNKPSFKI